MRTAFLRLMNLKSKPYGYKKVNISSSGQCERELMRSSPPVFPVPRVLLAEDNRPCQELVRLVLKQAGFKVEIVWNGARPSKL